MIEIIDTLGQKNNGSFPLVDSNDVKGGYYQVETIDERDSIPLSRRKEGMLCYVKNDKIFQLLYGIDNASWSEFKVGSDFDGDYESLINKPVIPVVDVDKEYVDIKLLEKSGVEHTHDELYPSKNSVYTTDEVDSLISNIPPCVPGDTNNVHVGESPPLESELEVWIDTSDDESYSSDISDLIINEFREMFNLLRADNEVLKKRILSLEARVEYLEVNGGGGVVPPNPDDSDDVILSLEDGELLTFEDGSILILESKTITQSSTALTFENNEVMTFEDESILTFE